MNERFALTTLFTGFGYGVSLIIGLALTPLMLRSLGAEGYGIWALVTSFSVTAGYLGVLDFGVQSSIVKFVAEYRARRELDAMSRLVSLALLLFGGFGVLGAAALVVFAQLFLTDVFKVPPGLVGVTRLLVYVLAVQTLFEFPDLVFSAVLEGIQRYDLQRLLQIGYVVCSAVSVAILLTLGYGLVAMGVTAAGLAIVRAVVHVTLVHRLVPSLRLTAVRDRPELIRLATFSGQVFLVRLVGIVHNTMDKTIIAALLSTTALTEYDIANKLRLIASGALGFITPQVVALASLLNATNEQERLRETFLAATKYHLGLALPAVVSVFVLAEPLVRIWIGPDYAYVANLGRLFVSYLLLDAPIDIGYNMMIGMGYLRPLLVIQTITTTGLNLLISIILTPRIGTAGVIWGTLISTGVGTGPYMWLYLRTLDITFIEVVRRVLLPTYLVAAGLAVFLYVGNEILHPDNILTLGGLGSSGVLLYMLAFWRLSLDGAEQTALLKLLRLRE